MKKVLAIGIAMTLMLSLLPVTAVMAVEPGVTSVTKSFDSDNATLTQVISGEIEVVTTVSGVTVTDELPEELTLIVSSVVVVPATGVTNNSDGNMIDLILGDAGTYTITFDAQVTHVTTYETITANNTATAQAGIEEPVSDWDTIDLLPYPTDYEAGFYKELVWAKIDGVGDNLDTAQLPTNKNIVFYMYLDVYNVLTTGVNMTNVVIKDNLGGDLEVDNWYVEGGSTSNSWQSGKTLKDHLIWNVPDMAPGQGYYSDLMVSTDMNTGRGTNNNSGNSGKNPKPGWQEYTDTESTDHELNSGPTLKFNASDTGFLCSVDAEGITVSTYVPPTP